MKKRSRIFLTIVFLAAILTSGPASAGIEEGLIALDKGEYELAFYELSKAAKLKDPEAQYHLGILYETGKGTEVDPKKAYEMLEASAKSGYVDAQYHLGEFMLDHLPDVGGAILWRHQRMAIDWIRQAGYGKSFEAQMALAEIYEKGEYLPADKIEAYAWLKRASRTLKPGAERNELLTRLIMMGEKMTVEEVEKARVLSDRSFLESQTP